MLYMKMPKIIHNFDFSECTYCMCAVEIWHHTSSHTQISSMLVHMLSMYMYTRILHSYNTGLRHNARVCEPKFIGVPWFWRCALHVLAGSERLLTRRRFLAAIFRRLQVFTLAQFFALHMQISTISLVMHAHNWNYITLVHLIELYSLWCN